LHGRLDGPPRAAGVLAIAWLVVVGFAESDAGVEFPRWIVLAGIGVVLLGWWGGGIPGSSLLTRSHGQ
jgi:hypothetical protein